MPRDATFCPVCGKPIVEEVTESINAFEFLGPSLLYYFGTLCLLGLFKLTTFFPEGFAGMAWISAIDIIIVIGFWVAFSERVNNLFVLTNIKIIVIGYVIAGAIISGFAVSILANLINITINDDVFYNYYLFEDTHYPELFAVLFICVQPAIFEEVAFRGFLFNNIQELSSSQTAIYVTSFLFGILHLTFISLIWLVPLGLVFAILRSKYNTLWYGMIGHFIYNFTILSIEYFQLL